MVCDADAMSRDAIVACTAGRGYSASGAATLAEALGAIEQAGEERPYDVLILDTSAASGEDIERLFAEIEPERRGIALVLITSYGSVEAAVMDLVPRSQHKVPMLLAGKDAEELIAKLAPYGVDMTSVGDDIGAASTIKMCRSVFMKGLDAILMECMVAHHRCRIFHHHHRRSPSSIAQSTPRPQHIIIIIINNNKTNHGGPTLLVHQIDHALESYHSISHRDVA